MDASALVDWLRRDPWSVTALSASAGILVALAATRAVLGLAGRATRGMSMAPPLLKAVQGPATLAVPLLVLQAVLQGAPNDLRFISNARHLNGLLLIGALTWFAVAVLSGLAEGIIARNPSNVADNLHARRVQTQVRVLARSAMLLAVIAGAALALMTFPAAKQLGASLLASAGVISLVAGLAARPVFSNLIAGLQLALAQPLRLDDVLIVKGEYGRVEEINGTYVVMKLWDERRMVVPLQWFIENPFENWTRTTAQLLQAVFLYLDFSTPLAPLRAELQRIVAAAPQWDRRVAALQVTDTTEHTMKVRVLVSAGSSGAAFELGCAVREGLIDFVARNYAGALPRARLSGEFQPADRATGALGGMPPGAAA